MLTLLMVLIFFLALFAACGLFGGKFSVIGTGVSGFFIIVAHLVGVFIFIGIPLLCLFALVFRTL